MGSAGSGAINRAHPLCPDRHIKAGLPGELGPLPFLCLELGDLFFDLCETFLVSPNHQAVSVGDLMAVNVVPGN